jgi:acyl transferase domain-containing protein
MAPRFGSFLGDVASFDAPAFGLSEAEVVLMDPQQRLLIVALAEARNTGVQPGAAGSSSSCGVYIGISGLDYNKLLSRLSQPLTAYSATGSLSLSVAAGRLSYTFGLQGPALAVDTACSSSLVAVHSALGGMQLGHCKAAAAGGVNVMLVADTPAMFQRAGEGQEHSSHTYCGKAQ